MTGPGQAARPAGVIGRVFGMIMARLNADMELAGVELLGLRGDERVLEIGYGPGVGIGALLTALPEGKVAGVDPSPVMHRQASRRASDSGVADLRIGGASSLGWPDGSFDGILAVNSAQFWPDPAADLDQVLRVLAPGGRVVIALRTGGGHDHAPLAETYAGLLRKRGLTVTLDTRTMRTGPALFLRAQRPGG